MVLIFRRRKVKKILLISLSLFFIFGCSKDSKKTNTLQKESTSIETDQQSEIVTTNNTFTEWWDYKYNSLLLYKENQYLKDFDIDTLMKYYRILSIEYFNTKGSGRYSNTSEKLAEKTGVRKEIFDELNNYIGLSYYKYLGEITKEYFENNDLGIKPDYYSPINSTVYIGVYTFNCEIVIDLCKDDPNFQTEVDKKVSYLKENLPPIIQGFRIFSVRYNFEKTGTSGSVNLGYLWVRDRDILLEMGEGKGTYGKQLPENTIHWQQDSWNDGRKIENNYTIE
jgi:hypothetical protein